MKTSVYKASMSLRGFDATTFPRLSSILKTGVPGDGMMHSIDMLVDDHSPW